MTHVPSSGDVAGGEDAEIVLGRGLVGKHSAFCPLLSLR